jgi:CRP/FNR family transcriptional regulator, cyclic AMP receptor protein
MMNRETVGAIIVQSSFWTQRGTTRSRITTFMNKFRKLGLIDYNGELVIRTEMLTDLVLHD